jgi:hypothetical protein
MKVYLIGVVMCLIAAYDGTSELDYLNEAIDIGRGAATTKPERLTVGVAHTLAMPLQFRYERMTETTDLDEAIEIHRT